MQQTATLRCNTSFAKKQSPLSKAAVQNKLSAGFCKISYTYKDLLFIQLCSESRTLHCSRVLGNKQSTLSKAAVHNMLSAGLCKYKYICEDFIQLCSDSTTLRCSSVLGSKESTLSKAAVHNMLSAGSCKYKYTYKDLLFIQLCTQWGVHSAKNSVAMEWCLVIAKLREQQVFIGVFALPKACTASLNSGDCMLPKQALQCIGVGSLHSCTNSKSS